MKPLIKSKKYSLQKLYGKDYFIYVILGISIGFSALLFLIGILVGFGTIDILSGAISSVDFFVFGLLSAIGPVGFYNNIKTKRIKNIQKQLPDFLRDISGSTSSGMTIFDAMHSAADADYGKLTPELKMMSSQLSWGISVNDALDNFAKRINTNSVKRMVLTVTKALEIGGNTSAVFEAAAREIDQVKLVEQQRKAEMSVYSMVIFISFFVFLAVILIINLTIFQAIFDLQGQMPTGGITGTNIGIAYIDQAALETMFFAFVVVQSIGGGLLGGYMMDGNLSSGVRYGFILVLISFFVFKVMI